MSLLPYIEQSRLYNEFHLDEPWDSPHNLTLVGRMPRTYALPGDEFAADARAGRTYYRAFVGRGAAFEPGEKLTVATFTDGLSNTMLVAEGAAAVPWTKADDELVWDGVNVPALGVRKDGSTLVLMGDFSIRPLPKSVSMATRKAAITRNAGDKPGNDW